MTKFLKLTPLVLLTIFITNSFAQEVETSKVDQILAVTAKQCNKDYGRRSAVRAVRLLYLNCVPGQIVKLDNDCSIDCLRKSVGAVIGGQ